MPDDVAPAQAPIRQRAMRKPAVIALTASMAVILVAGLIVAGLVHRYERHVDAEKADATTHAVQLANDVVRAVGRTPDKPVAQSFQHGERCNDGLGNIHGYNYTVFLSFRDMTAADVDRMRSTLKAYLGAQGFGDAYAEGMTRYYGGPDKLEKATVSYSASSDPHEADMEIEAGCVP